MALDLAMKLLPLAFMLFTLSECSWNFFNSCRRYVRMFLSSTQMAHAKGSVTIPGAGNSYRQKFVGDGKCPVKK